MSKYSKAYHLKELRQFPCWTEKNEADEATLSDNDIVYIWDNFTVVTSPLLSQKGIVFDSITPEWLDFCTTILKFEIPEDLRLSVSAD